MVHTTLENYFGLPLKSLQYKQKQQESRMKQKTQKQNCKPDFDKTIFTNFNKNYKWLLQTSPHPNSKTPVKTDLTAFQLVCP